MINQYVNNIFSKNRESLIDTYKLNTKKDIEHFKRKIMSLDMNFSVFFEQHYEIMDLCNKKNYDTIAMTVAYKLIDNFGWMYNEKKKIGSAYTFKHFVSSFLIRNLSDDVTVDELWSSRCGMYHQNTYESNHTAKDDSDIRFVVFYSNIKISKKDLLKIVNTIDYKAEDYCFLRMDELFKTIKISINEFFEYVIVSGRLYEIINKMAMMPLWYAYIDV